MPQEASVVVWACVLEAAASSNRATASRCRARAMMASGAAQMVVRRISELLWLWRALKRQQLKSRSQRWLCRTQHNVDAFVREQQATSLSLALKPFALPSEALSSSAQLNTTHRKTDGRDRWDRCAFQTESDTRLYNRPITLRKLQYYFLGHPATHFHTRLITRDLKRSCSKAQHSTEK